MRPTRNTDAVTIAALAVAVLAISASGPMIAFAAAPALAIAFWRNAIAVGALAPVAAVRRGHEIAALVTQPERRRDGLLCVLAGVALAAHFLTWIPSVKLTAVATATALGATQPVWQGLIAVAQGRRLPRLTWLGIGLAVAGAAAATGADITASATAVMGDLLALAGGVAVAIYTALGERTRMSTSTTAYTAVCYPVCTLLLLAVCLIARVPMTGYPATTWLVIAAMAAGPQLLGHSLFNFSLRRVSATTVSVLILLEVPGAALIAWAWLGQTPRPGAWPGLAMLLAGVAIVVLAGRRGRDAGPAPMEEPEAGVIAP